MESDRPESLQGSKMESDRPESLQGSKMESDRPESLQGSKMESDRPESLQGASSDEVHELKCCPCGTGGISRKGVFFCHTCREYLCKACKGHHENLKITKNHTIVS